MAADPGKPDSREGPCRGWIIRAREDKPYSEDNPGPGLWPDKGEKEDEFIDRCIDELTECIGEDAAENVCQAKWDSFEELKKSAERSRIMPLRKPKDGETQSHFMAYCMHELGKSETDRPQDQMVEIGRAHV